jgi:glycopeptide antibiotics resistance protein
VDRAVAAQSSSSSPFVRRRRADGVLTGSLALVAAIPLVGVVALARPSRVRTLVALAAIGHVTILASVAFFPIPVAPALAKVRDAGEMSWIGLNLVPFATIGAAVGGGFTAETWIAILNLFVLLPAGVYLPILVPSLRGPRAVVAVAIIGGVSVELIQLFVGLALGFLYRTVDIDDVILNTAGLAAGLVIGRRAIRRWPRLAGSEGD